MSLNSVFDAILLLALGIFGWMALSKMRVPAPEVLGPAVLIGGLRLMQVELPTSPSYIFPVVQIIIGIFIGSMLNKDSIRNLKPIALAASIIVAWALAVILIIGSLLSRYSALDLYTALLSVSMGGLPEITIIGLASGAGIAVIVTTQMLRLLITIFVFPVILKNIERRKHKTCVDKTGFLNSGSTKTDDNGNGVVAGSGIAAENSRSTGIQWVRITTTAVVATTGGLLFYNLGVPAGLMVGSTVFIALASIYGIQLSRLSPLLFNLLLVFIGISIADNIDLETVATLSDIKLLLPIIVATVLIFASSFAVSHLICRVTEWDYPSCFLAAAPGGFTMMTALAVQYEIDPFRVSMLHLARLLAIKISLPLIFMILMSR